jgi:hypothetical protein
MTASKLICLLALFIAVEQTACWSAIVINSDINNNSTQLFNPIDNQVVDVTGQLGLPNCEQSAFVTVNHLLYVIGGLCPAGTSASTFVFNAATNKTTQLADMNESRFTITAAAADNNTAIVVCGGFLSIPSCEKFDIANNKWAYIQSLPISFSYSQSSLTLMDRPYIFGGADDLLGNDNTKAVFTLDVGGWKKVADMPVALEGAGAIVMDDGTAMICGGNIDSGDSATACYIYTPWNDTWTTSPFSLATPRWAFTIVRYIGRLWVVAGLDNDSNPVQSVEVFDSVTGWKAQPVNNKLIADAFMTIAAVSG